MSKNEHLDYTFGLKPCVELRISNENYEELDEDTVDYIEATANSLLENNYWYFLDGEIYAERNEEDGDDGGDIRIVIHLFQDTKRICSNVFSCMSEVAKFYRDVQRFKDALWFEILTRKEDI